MVRRPWWRRDMEECHRSFRRFGWLHSCQQQKSKYPLYFTRMEEGHDDSNWYWSYLQKLWESWLLIMVAMSLVALIVTALNYESIITPYHSHTKLVVCDHLPWKIYCKLCFIGWWYSGGTSLVQISMWLSVLLHQTTTTRSTCTKSVSLCLLQACL